ncbi:MAG TPA: hypothetical protein VJL88_09800 [Nitrospira sp.]|nr:hypothetical protein [Nitrospira sp.]
MTQELVLGVLLSGLLGLLWLMTLAIWENKHSTSERSESESASHHDDVSRGKGALKTFAA